MRRVGTERGNETCDLGYEAKYVWIKVKKILLPDRDEELDKETIAGIAESIEVLGLLHPIAVRRITEKDENGDTTEKTVLVAGACRLAAMKRLRRKKIACFYVEGDETDAQLVRIAEDLWRKRLSVLRHAEKLAEYFKLASAKVNVSGQPGQKSKVGRPSGGIALAARELPLAGRSAEARRKTIMRAVKINQITPEAKRAAMEARLENNQRALLKIAKADGHKAQLRKIAELAGFPKKLNAPLSHGAKRAAAGGDISKKIQSPPVQPDATESTTNADDAKQSQRTTTFDEMVALWESDCRGSWAYLPCSERERFIEMLPYLCPPFTLTAIIARSSCFALSGPSLPISTVLPDVLHWRSSSLGYPVAYSPCLALCLPLCRAVQEYPERISEFPSRPCLVPRDR